MSEATVSTSSRSTLHSTVRCLCSCPSTTTRSKALHSTSRSASTSPVISVYFFCRQFVQAASERFHSLTRFFQVGNEPATGPSGFQFRSESSLAGRLSAESPFRDSALGMTSNGRNTPDSTFTLGDSVSRMDRDLISTAIHNHSNSRVLSPQPLVTSETRR